MLSIAVFPSPLMGEGRDGGDTPHPSAALRAGSQSSPTKGEDVVFIFFGLAEPLPTLVTATEDAYYADLLEDDQARTLTVFRRNFSPICQEEI
jgi:hypothetical protein